MVLQFIEQQVVYNETDSAVVCATLSGATERTVIARIISQDITATGVEMFLCSSTFLYSSFYQVVKTILLTLESLSFNHLLTPLPALVI